MSEATETRATDVHLAIVGSGIAGCSASDFTHQEFNNIEIDVFEKQSRIGGRIHETEFDEYTFEVGAMAFHEESRYMKEYIDRFGLERADPFKLEQEPSDEPMVGRSYAVWDGQRLTAEMSYSLGDGLSLLGKYGLSLPRLWWLSRRVFKQFNSLYDVLEDGKHFESADAMLGSVNLSHIARQPAGAYLREHGVSPACIEEILDPLSRTLYGQDARMNALVDLIIFKAGFSRWYSIRGGNTQLLECLLDAASATLYTDTKITSITANAGTYTLTTTESSEEYGPYDAVIIATPLEKTDIEFDGITTSVASDREYQSMHNCFVKGVLDPTYFGMETHDDHPAIIGTTTDVDGTFNTIEIAREQDDANIHLLNSTSRLSNDLLETVFSSIENVERFPWDAYPVYEPPLSYPPFQLDSSLYYVNAMESAISTMETEVMGSRNVINHLATDVS